MSEHQRYGLRSLRFKLVLASVVVEAVMLSVLVWNSTRITGDALQEMFLDRVTTLVPMLNVSLADPLAQRDFASLDERLGRVVSSESLMYVEVRDELGKVVAQRGTVPDIVRRDTSFDLPDQIYHQAVDITLGGQIIGRARYGLNVSLLKTTVSGLRNQGAFLASIEIVITIFLLAGLGYLLTRHLKTLAQAARAVARGDYTVRVPIVGQDEVADAARAFNSMATTVEGDFAERTEAEAALRQSEEHFRTIFEQATDGILVSDVQGNLLDANSVSCQMFGYSAEKLLKMRNADLVVPEEVERIVPETARLLGGATVRSEWRLRRSDGSILLVEVSAKQLPDGRLQAFLRDITERKQADDALRQLTQELEQRVQVRTSELQTIQMELRAKNDELEEQYQQIQQANRLKSEFLANMSHELRTPLNAIIGFSELMHDGKVGPVSSDHKEYLGDVLSSAKHLLQIINDVLDLAKVESGKLEFTPEPVNLATTLGEVRDVVRALILRKRMRVKVEVEPALTSVFTDVGKLKQILYNYLSNALKFSPDESEITVRACVEDAEHYRVEVEDQGVGIEASDIDRLFSEFQQLDSGFSKKHAGTGLGLALTKRIAEAQGGRVGVNSRLGLGSTFYAILPRVLSELANNSVGQSIQGAKNG